ncbi:MAG: Fe-S cluster assembly ATPase SufC [Bacilli bacterium]|nr:Fe-S cluster assembly ATPase SufC [Bacilli bacterium]
MLTIKDLTVKVSNKTILENFNLEIKEGEIHALMGKNGAGKSTISKVLLRDLDYTVTHGLITYQNKDLLKLNTTEVAQLGFYLVSQNPIEIDGITNAELIRCALNEQGKNDLNILELNNKLKKYCEKLEIPTSFIHRNINYNMSGGEKKKMELLHIWMLEPKMIILDEIDSGLDVDALKIVANALLEYHKQFKPSLLIITHQQKLLEILKPDKVHILENKKVTQTGDLSLAKKIFENGFSRATLMANGEKNE